jgi:hypothetical protein
MTVHRSSRWVVPFLAALFACTSACGSGGGGGGGGGSGLVLVNFLQASEDRIPLNQVLEFRFSGDLDPDTVSPASIQIRQGPAFGASVEGRYVVVGSRVFFEPRLPGTCDFSDSGLQPDSDYRVIVIGSPEEFAVRDVGGEPLERTVSFTFRTRVETDPLGLFEDQVPGVLPFVADHTPRDGAHPPVDPEVNIGPSNRVTVDFSENVDPCSITDTSVVFEQAATGERAEQPNGFNPDSDQTLTDPYSWGSGTPTTPRRRIRATLALTQSFLSTRLVITPDFGEFPDNALLVVTLTSDVRDFGGQPLVQKTFAFVTENRDEQCGTRTMRFDGDVPIDENQTTAEVDTTRAPDRAQGFLLFAGDGDNGESQTTPSGPDCEGYFQANDGSPDDFDTGTSNVVLDTGASTNTDCTNTTDGSHAVVFEYRTFRIRSGRTVRIVGENPAIILVRGDIVIEAGGQLLVKSSSSTGGNGAANAPTSQPIGGSGVAGGGDGGPAVNGGSGNTGVIYSGNGEVGYGSPDWGTPAGMGGATPILAGQGRGSVSLGANGTGGTDNLMGAGGGGGGHSTPGGAGAFTSGGGTTPRFYEGPIDGAGGTVYGELDGTQPTPEAGSGGGGAGYVRNAFSSGTFYAATGGAGGAGGGFVDLTSSGDIRVFGTIDATGGMGGSGASPTTFRAGSGGGGGGSGGGIRLLTPGDIELGTSATVTAGGGGGGAGVGTQQTPIIAGNNGGNGGLGRVTFEDDDSVITGLAGAVVIPAESSSAGFYRGPFDASRFQGGGLEPQLVTDLVDSGPASPTFLEPVQTYGTQEDFRVGVPAVSSLGVGRTAMFFEVQGFPSRVDGTPDLSAPSGWKHVGYFTDSGSETFPQWHSGTPADVTVPSDGTPGGFAAVNGNQFVQFRVTFYLRPGVGPFDPGAFLDDWTFHVCYDQ